MSEEQVKLPIPALRETAYTTKLTKLQKRLIMKKKSFSEKAITKKELDAKRGKTRVNIGAAFERWRNLKQLHPELKRDEMVAEFLLERYERDISISKPIKPHGKRPHPSSSMSSVISSPERDDTDFSDTETTKGESPAEESDLDQMDASVSSVDQNESFNVEEFNSLNNAIIDWEDDTWPPQKEDRALTSPDKEVDSDEGFMPRICVRTGGVPSTKVNIDNVPEVSLDEFVHDGGADEPESIPTADVHDEEEEEVVGHPASIAYHTPLRQLVEHLQLPEQACRFVDPNTMATCGDPKPFKVQIISKGTAAIIEWTCAHGHPVWKWTSQRFLNDGLPVGDFLLSSNVLISGNNYAKIALLFKFMNMGMVNKTTFQKIQDLYCIDTIKELWNTKRSEIIARLQKKASVVALGDAQIDRPCFSAQHCAYTTMDNDTKEIICVVNMDNRKTAGNSMVLEREAFIRTFDMLHKEVKLSEFCTDAHVQISSLFEKGQYKDSGVRHSIDMWHGSKTLAKKIHAAGQQKDCTILNEWNKDICNHFWYCCRMAANYDTFFDMWTGVLNHVTGEHSAVVGVREPTPLTDKRDMPLIQKKSKAHRILAEVVLNEQWLKSVKKYLTFRSTAELESFHNHILMYAGKHFRFSPSVHEARVLLAALDYNHHHGRSPKRNATGEYQYRKLYNKKSRKWILLTQTEVKNYSYIPELQRAVLQRYASGESMIC